MHDSIVPCTSALRHAERLNPINVDTRAVSAVVCAMFSLPSLHNPDGYDKAIKNMLDAGITLNTCRLVKADRAGTGKPMSKDAFHEFLQKRIASCEAEITDISQH